MPVQRHEPYRPPGLTNCRMGFFCLVPSLVCGGLVWKSVLFLRVWGKARNLWEAPMEAGAPLAKGALPHRVAAWPRCRGNGVPMGVWKCDENWSSPGQLFKQNLLNYGQDERIRDPGQPSAVTPISQRVLISLRVLFVGWLEGKPEAPAGVPCFEKRVT